MRKTAILLGAVLVPALAAAAKDPAAPFIGRWDLSIATGAGARAPSWLEVTREGDALRARMVGRGGSVFPVPDVNVTGDELVWKTVTGRDNKVETVYRAKRKGVTLAGTVSGAGGKEEALTGTPAPVWKTPAGAAAKKKPGKPVVLFDGKSTDGWLPQDKGKPLGWVVTDGALDNQGKANNIYTDKSFTDFKLEVEYSIPAHSNSGIYLRGRHEIQVMDDAGKPPESHGNGAIYGFLTPQTNATKPAGEWQKVEATLVGNRVTVTLNGTKIIDDQEIPGITGGALDSDEGKPGPVLLQGDHGPVRYRKVVITPLK
jgi:hypothetical protein